jgi:hypothetical protein
MFPVIDIYRYLDLVIKGFVIDMHTVYCVVRVALSFAFFAVFCRSLFVLFLLADALLVRLDWQLSCIVSVSVIGGGNQSTQRKSQICLKSLTNLITMPICPLFTLMTRYMLSFMLSGILGSVLATLSKSMFRRILIHVHVQNVIRRQWISYFGYTHLLSSYY